MNTWYTTKDSIRNLPNKKCAACAGRSSSFTASSTTGIEKNPCRKARMPRNHIARTMAAWLRLSNLARKTEENVYRIKQGLLDDHLYQHHNNPSVEMRFAYVLKILKTIYRTSLLPFEELIS